MDSAALFLLDRGHMNELIPIKTASQSFVRLTKRSSYCRCFVLTALTFGCLALSLVAQAAPDGDVGNGNTAEGTVALARLTSGPYNTAMGLQALFNTTTGYYNTGTGVNALYNNTTGIYNTATGVGALFNNTTAIFNTATGFAALF